MSEKRPLSPHLQIYQPQLTWLLSITHRFTGIALALGLFLFTWWIMAIAGGADCYRTFQTFAGSWIGRIMLLGWTVALYFHLLNGIRHLSWDAGVGLSLKAVYRTGWSVLIGTLVLTMATWAYALWRV